MSSAIAVNSAKNLTQGKLRVMLNDIIVNWHPDGQAAVVTLAVAEQLPADIKKYAAQTSTPFNTIAFFRHLDTNQL